MADRMEALAIVYACERQRLLQTADAQKGMMHLPVFGEGALQPRLLLIGEAPGAEETVQSRPFVGKAGKQLDAILENAHIERTALYITNAVKYRPITPSPRGGKNRTPSKKEVEAALDALRAEIQILKPPYVATLGNVPLWAVQRLCAKTPQTIGDIHGAGMALCMQGHAFTLFPLYHPASVIYNRALLPVCEADALRLGDLVNNR